MFHRMIEESGRNSSAMADRRQLFAEMRMYFSVLLWYDGEHVDINTFIHQRCISDMHMLRSDSKDISEGSCDTEDSLRWLTCLSSV